MAKKIFERVEKKYLLDKAKYHNLLQLLEDKMEVDPYGKYTISNIYFDTNQYQLIRKSIEKPVYKEKLRLRSYGVLNDNITDYSKNFVVTSAILPSIVQLVIMMVNGNVGVAVMGAFSLVRFRSIPGSAKEIGSIFLTMAIGLATDIGYIGIAAIFLAIIAVVNIIFYSFSFAEKSTFSRDLKITIWITIIFLIIYLKPMLTKLIFIK